ncbi:MAG: methyltransferase, partial [bacterium]
MTEPSRPAAFYDARWTEAWGDLQERGPFHRWHRRIAARLLSSLPYDSALDVGCGAGQHLALLARLRPGARLVGTDLSPRALEAAAARCPGEYRVLDIEQARLPETFDLVTCFQVVEHLAGDAAAVRNLAAMSKRWVLVSTMQGTMAPHEAELGHVRRYTRNGLESLLRSAGVEPVRVVEWGRPFYSLFELIQSHLPR